MTAIIPAAGKGTRFLPATRVIPKEMLPIGAKPAIHCIVEEALAAGADDIVLVISEEKEIIRRYFEGDETLSGKVRYVYQREQRGLGHAVLQAAEGVTGTALVLLGDALVTGPNPSREMVAISKANGGASVIGLERVPPERVSRYGIVAFEKKVDAPQPSTLNPQLSTLTSSWRAAARAADRRRWVPRGRVPRRLWSSSSMCWVASLRKVASAGMAVTTMAT